MTRFAAKHVLALVLALCYAAVFVWRRYLTG